MDTLLAGIDSLGVQNRVSAMADIAVLSSLIQAIIYKTKRDGISKGTWRKIDLYEVLQERNEKNVEGRTICSVSVSQGVVNQIEYLGRSFAAKQTSHYNVVKYGDIVYTKSPTGDFPYGIIKRSDIREDVAVSPLYGVYIPANDSMGVILHFYFMQPCNAFNYLHPLIQKGAKNTINTSNGRFLENSVPLPVSESEANTIAVMLKSIQAKIEIEKKLLQLYAKEKEYLLHQMFI
ncbi:restriction endonuclease subunit S domain-containing protein [Bacteroides hominis]